MTHSWPPSSSLKILRQRAEILQTIRHFFAQRQILEVETPVLSHTSVTDPHIESIPALLQMHAHAKFSTYYLQTSPEYAMKRLLAAGSGAIYQITKSFRQGEIGRFHNPEFTMLEWYRPGFTHLELMQEMDELLQIVLQTPAAEKITYANLFQTYFQFDPHQITLTELKNCARENNIQIENLDDRDTWLQLLLTHCIEPKLGQHKPCFIYDFPASQAALAQIQPSNPPVASRFEVYFQGIELANGFHELQDAYEQRKRFEKNNEARKELGLAVLPLDENLLAALSHSLPDCAGVALGIDRLIMLATGSRSIAEVISFDFNRA